MKNRALISLLFALGIASCASTDNSSIITIAHGNLLNANGVASGTITISENAYGLHFVVKAQGLSPGKHGIHIHTIGSCIAPDFTSAGGHLNPNHMQHGLLNPQGHHMGDLPQITANQSGKTNEEFDVNAKLDDLFDADGSAIVIHAGQDDGITDPSGNSGARLLCGVLVKN